jgi:hypothetical protein
MEKQPKSENQQLHDQVLRCRNFNKEKKKVLMHQHLALSSFKLLAEKENSLINIKANLHLLS